MENLAVQSLLIKRDELLAEKAKMEEQFDTQIGEIETAINQLSGKKAWEIDRSEYFDDTHPNYIKGSFEEM